VLTLSWTLLRGREATAPPTVEPEVPSSDAGVVDALAASTPPLRLAAESKTPPLEDVIASVLPAIVSIKSSLGTGSGFFVDDYTVVTNLHVVGDDREVEIKMHDGDVVSGRVERVSSDHDLALIHALRPLEGHDALKLAPVDSVKVGQDVLVIGSPLGILDSSVTRGIVSAVRPTEDATLIQTDAAINPGNSGGPVINRRGGVIGIATMKAAQGENLGFAVAADHARELLQGGGSRKRRAGDARAGEKAPTSLADLTASEHERLLDEVFDRYRSTLDALVLQISACTELKSRFRGKSADERYFETGRLVLDYVNQRRIYARSRRFIPKWSGMACLQRNEALVTKGYEAIAVYDQVYKSYVSKSARRGRAAHVARQLPEI